MITGTEQVESEGDAAVYDGDLATALRRYGSAIDAHLAARDFSAAVSTCRKLIRVAPNVARARFTLAFLLIRQGDAEDARAQLKSYVQAVRAASAVGFAIPRLQLLAHATADKETRALIESLILDLGGAVVPPLDERSAAGAVERWERVLRTVLMDPAG